MKERGQKCDRQTDTHTDTHRQTLVFIGRALLRNVPFKKKVQFHCLVPELLADEVGVQFTGKFAL